MTKLAFAVRRMEHLPYMKTIFRVLKEKGYEIDLFIDSKYFPGETEVLRILAKNEIIVSKIQQIDKDSRIVFQLKKFAGVFAYLTDKDSDTDYFTRYLHRSKIELPLQKLLILNKFKFIRFIYKIGLKLLRTMAYLAASISKIYRIDFDYDVLFVTPGNMLDSVEDSVLLIAKLNKVPSVVLTLSLDNLNSKGTVIQVPTRYLAWNDLHKMLLIKRHLIPSERIEICGSPYFESYAEIFHEGKLSFENLVVASSEASKKLIIYLGSSANVCHREDLFLKELIENSQEILEKFEIMIRPHPANTEIWRNWVHPGTLIYPRNSDLLDRNPIETMNTLKSAACCIGINTSAFLDSIACDVPIIALKNKKALFQQNASHFNHLVNSGMPIISSLSELENTLYVKYPNNEYMSSIRNQVLPNFGKVSESIFKIFQELSLYE